MRKSLFVTCILMTCGHALAAPVTCDGIFTDYLEKNENTVVINDDGVKSKGCSIFNDDQLVTVHGKVVQSAEGEPPHTFMALALDSPICFSGDVNAEIFLIVVFPIKMKWIGHHVAISGNMTAGDSWSINVQHINDE